MAGNKPILFKDEPFGTPSKTKDVDIGDLVRVVYLPVTMSHFFVVTGVVSEKSKYGNWFMITAIDKNGREIQGASNGWYDPENVEILVKGYRQVQVSYKPLPQNLKL